MKCNVSCAVVQDMFPDGSVFKEVKYLDIDNSDPSNIKSKPKQLLVSSIRAKACSTSFLVFCTIVLLPSLGWAHRTQAPMVVFLYLSRRACSANNRPTDEFIEIDAFTFD